MKRYRLVFISILVFGLFLFPAALPTAHAQEVLPVVRAVLFYSPQCPHCHYVIEETLPPLIRKYGNQLNILYIDVTVQSGQILFVAALKKFDLESSGVPFLVIGDDTYLVGSDNIPAEFPGLIESHLAQGGVDWPNIPGLDKVLSLTVNLTATALARSTPVQGGAPPAAASPAIHSGTSDWLENFGRDPAGSTLAVIVLLGMLGAVAWTVALFRQTETASGNGKRQWVIPILCVVGFGVAGYLSYIEMAQVSAVCGPVGDCNTVQQSEYARLFGILPVGVLGLAGYVAIVAAWWMARSLRGRLTDYAALSLFAMSVFGTIFSIYLTFLEPFVIGATCAWCLTSAVLMTVLMLLSVRPAKVAFSRLAPSILSRKPA